MKILDKIPGYENIESDGIVKQFAAEIKLIKTEDDLKKFVVKWRQIWVLRRNSNQFAIKFNDQIISIDFDLNQALQCIIRANNNKTCKHATSWGLNKKPKKKRLLKKAEKKGGNLCHGMQIVLPEALIKTVYVTIKFGVPDGVAMHQLFCTGPHDDCF